MLTICNKIELRRKINIILAQGLAGLHEGVKHTKIGHKNYRRKDNYARSNFLIRDQTPNEKISLSIIN